MDDRASHFLATIPWDDIQYFLAIARVDSASEAARNLGLSHTTLSRRLKALEAKLGIALFHRSGQRLQLTAQGEAGFVYAVKMEEAARDFQKRCQAAAAALKGDVCILGTEGLCTYWLMPALRPFSRKHPGLKLNWMTTNSEWSRLLAAADIAMPWWRPSDPNFVARILGRVRYSVFGTPAYARQFGLPETTDDLGRHSVAHFNGYETNPGLKVWNDLMLRFPPTMRVENTVSALQVMQTDEFVTLLPDYSEVVSPGTFVRAPVDLGISLELWISYREKSRRNVGIRSVATEIIRLATEGQGTWLER